MVHALTRYRSLIDDVDSFCAAATRPLPTCLWVNPLKADAATLQAHLAEAGIELEPVDWMEGAYRAHGWSQPGRTLPFITGWYVVQEEIAMTAIAALDPQPGERVLDLCAAPGNKTVHIAARLAATGMVVANEWKTGRLASLWSAIARMGLLNVLTLNEDGRSLDLPLQFDRVLVDAPCSAEGTCRKKPHRFSSAPQSLKAIAQLVPVQQALLERALRLVKPGGVVVYSTCTFSPEENEAVLDAVVGDRGSIEPFHIEGLQAAAGVTAWQGQSFRQDIAHAHRYWPHLNDTGGFFVARIRRHLQPAENASALNDCGDRPPLDVPPQWADPSVLQFMSDRFGIDPHALQSLRLLEKGRDKVWLLDLPSFGAPSSQNSNATPVECDPLEQAIATLPFQNLGLPLVRKSRNSSQLKPTTAALQRLGPLITRNVVKLNQPEQVAAYVAGRSQPLPDSHASPHTLNDGYVHVRFGPFELGCGLLRQGLLQSQLPKALRLL